MRPTPFGFVLLALIGGATVRLYAAQPVPPLILSFGDQSVSASGVAPKADVYAFSIAREYGVGLVNVVPREILLHDDGSGQVRWSPGEAIPVRSIWFFADLSSGAFVSGAPVSYRLAHEVTLTARHLKKNAVGDIEQLAGDGDLVEFLVVRPGSGAWREVVSDGGILDEDSQGSKVSISVFNLQPVTGTKEQAPKSLKNGDIVFLVCSYAASYGAARVGE